jgi:hypothetical protein
MSGTLFALLKLLLSRRKEGAVSMAEATGPELRQALETRRCGLCRRGCRLSAPRCRRGAQLRDALIESHASH